MAKMSKDELISKINGLEIDDNVKIELMEDVTDSFEVSETDNTELEEVKTKYEELKTKYKERFLKGDDKEDKEEKEDDEEMKEEEVVDVKEI